MYPGWLIERSLNLYLYNVQNPNNACQEKKTKRYFKLPYIGKTSKELEKRINNMVKQYCKDLHIILSFSSFKLSSLLSVKDSIPQELRARVIYQFTCARCKARYIGQTKRHYMTRVQEHLGKDKNSHIWKHLQSSPQCLSECNTHCFKILDTAQTDFQLKIKEGLFIKWKKPQLNQQVYNYQIMLSI